MDLALRAFAPPSKRHARCNRHCGKRRQDYEWIELLPRNLGPRLIGPVNEDDEQDLIDTILAVGGGVADPELVQAFVHGIPQAIDWLEQDLGVSSSVRKAPRVLNKSNLSPALTTRRACGAASPASPLRTL